LPVLLLFSSGSMSSLPVLLRFRQQHA
jgi:hypothetical protein